MNSSIERWKNFITKRLIVPVIALAMIAGVGTYEIVKPMQAKAAPTPSAPALDDNSVGALLSLDQAMETLAARVTPAIVNVTVTSHSKSAGQQMPEDMRQFFGPFGQFMMPNQQAQPRVEHGLGSGVIISPDGYIVTNNHVIDGAMDIRVTMSDRRILPAKLIGADPLTDLAVIKIEGHNFPSVPWGDSTKLRPGQLVLAFGNPFGYRFTVTRGIVSALNRPNPNVDDPRKPGEYIQTDAAINPGNSGGPLVDARGEVIGINTFLISPSGSFSGMGFAIPTQIAQPTAETLIRSGKIEHGYMGIGINDVTPDNSKFFHMDKAVGAVVTQVTPDSPAAKAGLKVGDVITELDGRPVNNAGELQVEVGQKAPGTAIKLGIQRDGKDMSLPVTLEAMDKSNGDNQNASSEHGKPRWGLGLSDVTPDAREQLQAPANVHGALVQQVQPGSPADNAGLQRGDVIMEVDRKPVQNAADATQALRSIGQGQDALLLVWSNGGNTFRVMHAAEPSQNSGE
ncbi:MAG TPA: Do family serine endopeptidase [Terriglobales bacterium]|nr:Do family serine endopeptidase [Terriglobales bacterium]